jgi:hypothetical protein
LPNASFHASSSVPLLPSILPSSIPSSHRQSSAPASTHHHKYRTRGGDEPICWWKSGPKVDTDTTAP